MSDAPKTTDELLAELASLRARMAELESARAEHDRTLRSLRESEARYRRIFENANDMIYTHDMEGNFTSANPATLRTYNYPLDEFLRLNIRHVVDPDYLPIAQESIQKKLRGITYTEPYELITRAKDGSPVWVEVSSRVIKEQGRLVGVQGILRNITERKRVEEALRRAHDELEIRVQERTAELTAANRQLQREIAEHQRTEQALRESEGRYRLLAENVTDVIWTTDLDLRFKYISPSTIRLRGYTVDEARGQMLGDILTPASYEEVMKLFESLLPLERLERTDPPPSWTLDLEVTRRDGSTVWTEVKTSLLYDPEGRPVGFLGVTRDISERKRAETEKAKLQEQLHQAQKMQAIGQLAAGVAHDFTNLLAVILGHTAQAKKLLPTSDQSDGHLNLVEEAGQQAMDLAKSLLTFSRKVPSEKRPVNLCRLVAESTQLLRRMLPASINLSMAISDEQPIWVDGDPTQLQQVVLNLILNARDAMPDGGTLRVGVSREPDGQGSPGAGSDGDRLCARIEISDTGTGMSPEVRPRIFEPFFTTKRRGQGAGLGLSIVHGVVEAHGGRIEVDSHVGRGSTFGIILPCIPEQAALRVAGSKRTAPDGDGGLILLAEGHRLLREIMVSALRSLGYEVIQAGDGTEALQSYQRHREEIRLLILDMELSHHSGFECVDRLRAEGDPTPVIVLSDKAAGDTIGELDSQTVLLGRPFTMPELGSLVRRVLSATEGAETNR